MSEGTFVPKPVYHHELADAIQEALIRREAAVPTASEPKYVEGFVNGWRSAWIAAWRAFVSMKP